MQPLPNTNMRHLVPLGLESEYYRHRGEPNLLILDVVASRGQHSADIPSQLTDSVRRERRTVAGDIKFVFFSRYALCNYHLVFQIKFLSQLTLQSDILRCGKLILLFYYF